MDYLAIRILVMAIWSAVVGWIAYSMAKTDTASESEAATVAEAASDTSTTLSVCFEDCLNDLLGNPNRVNLCRNACA